MTLSRSLNAIAQLIRELGYDGSFEQNASDR